MILGIKRTNALICRLPDSEKFYIIDKLSEMGLSSYLHSDGKWKFKAEFYEARHLAEDRAHLSGLQILDGDLCIKSEKRHYRRLNDNRIQEQSNG